ncbi:MAG: MFS transporter [Muribaculaceae bacterium]|nr:MFS transporter [Muribaculaceae bacterium]
MQTITGLEYDGHLYKGNYFIYNGSTILVEHGKEVNNILETATEPFTLTVAAIAVEKDGSLETNEATSYEISNPKDIRPVYKTVLNASTQQYNDAGNWLGLLFAVQAVGSVLWAVVLPRFRSRRFSYILSLLLGAAGFIMTAFITNQYLLFIAFILIGCAWAAMLAWPFTILTNSIKGGNIGGYLGLFNCTICIPQIVAALAGGWILHMLSTPGELAPEYMMMFVAGISLIIGAACVFLINEKKNEQPEETPALSEDL